MRTNVLGTENVLGAAIAARRGHAARAIQMREAALALVANPAATDKRLTATRARTLLALGRVDDAAPLVERLFAAGYRHPVLVADWTSRAHKP